MNLPKLLRGQIYYLVLFVWQFVSVTFHKYFGPFENGEKIIDQSDDNESSEEVNVSDSGTDFLGESKEYSYTTRVLHRTVYMRFDTIVTQGQLVQINLLRNPIYAFNHCSDIYRDYEDYRVKYLKIKAKPDMSFAKFIGRSERVSSMLACAYSATCDALPSGNMTSNMSDEEYVNKLECLNALRPGAFTPVIEAHVEGSDWVSLASRIEPQNAFVLRASVDDHVYAQNHQFSLRLSVALCINLRYDKIGGPKRLDAETIYLKKNNEIASGLSRAFLRNSSGFYAIPQDRIAAFTKSAIETTDCSSVTSDTSYTSDDVESHGDF